MAKIKTTAHVAPMRSWEDATKLRDAEGHFLLSSAEVLMAESDAHARAVILARLNGTNPPMRPIDRPPLPSEKGWTP